MKLSIEELKDLRGAIEAALNGKPVEARFSGSDDEWHLQSPEYYNFQHSTLLWRAQPESITRPWNKPEDLPGPVCWLRPISGGVQLLVLQIDKTGLCAGYVMVTTSEHLITWDRLGSFEYSTDRKTWKPCEVTE